VLILFDLSALLAAAERLAPVGIPRVELAYAKHLLATVPERLAFTATNGRLGMLNRNRAVALIETLDRLWSGDAVDQAAHRRVTELARRMRAASWLRGERPIYDCASASGAAPITYLVVSHPTLERPWTLARVKQRTGARLICLIHDLIGIEFPSFVQPGFDIRHQRRMAGVARLADGVIANSVGTAASFRRCFEATGFAAPLVVAPLGIDLHLKAQPAPGDGSSDDGRHPYFVYLATIEPRKNHRLLLALWHRLAAEVGPSAPRLVLIGRRGWDGDNILGTVQRSAALRGLVEVRSGLPDGAVARLLAGAQALLYPSLAEGYGLPVAEALALGVPVVCSDLAELREVGKAVPDYLDPANEAAWGDAIRSYATNGSVRRQAQLARLGSWRAPRWEAHFALVDPLIDCGGIASQRGSIGI
jgi:glycosyltransferase involved in cell wall biosynthesis